MSDELQTETAEVSPGTEHRGQLLMTAEMSQTFDRLNPEEVFPRCRMKHR